MFLFFFIVGRRREEIPSRTDADCGQTRTRTTSLCRKEVERGGSLPLRSISSEELYRSYEHAHDSSGLTLLGKRVISGQQIPPLSIVASSSI